MLGDADAARVAVALALCLIKEANDRWIKQWYRRIAQYTHTHTHTHT